MLFFHIIILQSGSPTLLSVLIITEDFATPDPAAFMELSRPIMDSFDQQLHLQQGDLPIEEYVH